MFAFFSVSYSSSTHRKKPIWGRYTSCWGRSEFFHLNSNISHPYIGTVHCRELFFRPFQELSSSPERVRLRLSLTFPLLRLNRRINDHSSLKHFAVNSSRIAQIYAVKFRLRLELSAADDCLLQFHSFRFSSCFSIWVFFCWLVF